MMLFSCINPLPHCNPLLLTVAVLPPPRSPPPPPHPLLHFYGDQLCTCFLCNSFGSMKQSHMHNKNVHNYNKSCSRMNTVTLAQVLKVYLLGTINHNIYAFGKNIKKFMVEKSKGQDRKVPCNIITANSVCNSYII